MKKITLSVLLSLFLCACAATNNEEKCRMVEKKGTAEDEAQMERLYQKHPELRDVKPLKVYEKVCD